MITGYEPDTVILSELGKRLKDMRIAQEMTQGELARKAGVSQKSLGNIETGKDVTMGTFLRVLRGLDMLANLEHLVPEQPLRPSEAIRLGKKRQRVRKTDRNVSGRNWKWGDEK